jgi:hypothetical protein
MLLLVHISLALLSLVVSTSALKTPSLSKIRANFAIAVATLVSGAFLVFQSHASLASACSTGLLYLGFVTAMNVGAYFRLEESER